MTEPEAERVVVDLEQESWFKDASYTAYRRYASATCITFYIDTAVSPLILARWEKIVEISTSYPRYVQKCYQVANKNLGWSKP